MQESPRGVAISVLDCVIGVNEIERCSSHYIYLRFNILGKGMDLSLPFFYKDGVKYLITHEGWYVIKYKRHTKPLF